MLGTVDIRTHYIRPDAAPNLPEQCCPIEVSPLLRALILAMIEEPEAYDQKGRASQIAALALAEIRILKTPALHLPMPA